VAIYCSLKEDFLDLHFYLDVRIELKDGLVVKGKVINLSAD
jgi:small nuclear ribonucleoprotein (snRNP)-like protein